MNNLSHFAVFIMVHGRPEKMWTLPLLRARGYTGKVYLIADNLDPTHKDYISKYGKEMVVVFDKKKAAERYDSGDNTGDLRSTMYAANESFNIAEKLGLSHFCLMCDDYYSLGIRQEEGERKIKNLDRVFATMLDFYESTNIKSIAFSQGGDHIGGFKGVVLLRKAMNSFLCSVNRRFEFMGRMNEDVTTYVNLGGKGDLFFTFCGVNLSQRDTQIDKKGEGGLSGMYTDYGTYTKSFFSVMYNPSCVSIKMMITRQSSRIHHSIKWRFAVPLILDECFKKR